MISDQSKAEPLPAKPSSNIDANDDLGSLHSIGLAIALRDVAQRLSSLEEKLEKNRAAGSRNGEFFIELCKVVFAGWPVLGLVFLFLFYSPLREALNAIPEKVRTAAEIGALGVSLKSALQVEAAKLGAGNLSETIPRLSAGAIELLLRAPRNAESLVSYTRYDKEMLETIELPSASKMDALSELQAQGLIVLESSDGPLSGTDARGMLDQFFKTHPGREEPSTNNERLTWKPNKPFKDYPVMLMWQLSDLGKKAVEIILKAVSTELAPKPSPKPNG